MRSNCQSHKQYYLLCDFDKAFSLCKFSLNRKWGQSIARGWAQLIINRLRNQVDSQGGNNEMESMGDEDDANAQYGFFNRGADRGGGFFRQG